MEQKSVASDEAVAAAEKAEHGAEHAGSRGPSAPTDLSLEARALVPVLAGSNRRWLFRPRST
jgi:hypothetical protein